MEEFNDVESNRMEESFVSQKYEEEDEEGEGEGEEEGKKAEEKKKED